MEAISQHRMYLIYSRAALGFIGFRVPGSGLKVLGFRLWGLGSRVQGLDFGLPKWCNMSAHFAHSAYHISQGKGNCSSLQHRVRVFGV